MRNIIALGIVAFAASSQAQIVVMDFNTAGQGFTYGDWLNNFIDAGGTRQIVSPAKANGGTGVGFLTNLSGVAGARFEFRGRVDTGNASNIQILLEPSAGAANPGYRYYWDVQGTAFTPGVFQNFLTNPLGTPDFVLDANNGFAFVGSGAAFAPDLANIQTIQIQGGGYNGANDFRWTFDNLQVVPEPGTMIALGLGLTGILARRKKK